MKKVSRIMSVESVLLHRQAAVVREAEKTPKKEDGK